MFPHAPQTQCLGLPRQKSPPRPPGPDGESRQHGVTNMAPNGGEELVEFVPNSGATHDLVVHHGDEKRGRYPARREVLPPSVSAQ